MYFIYIIIFLCLGKKFRGNLCGFSMNKYCFLFGILNDRNCFVVIFILYFKVDRVFNFWKIRELSVNNVVFNFI